MRMVRLVHEAIDVASLLAPSSCDGAVAVFLGVVRNNNAGRVVTHLEYEAFEEMALPLLEAIETEVRATWAVTDVRIVHRLGSLQVGEVSVAVVATSPHRPEAFAAARFAIDTLKARVPIWKKEHYPDSAEWVTGEHPTTPAIR
jgi:molybdopterin synthase catalytic subunit